MENGVKKLLDSRFYMKVCFGFILIEFCRTLNCIRQGGEIECWDAGVVYLFLRTLNFSQSS